MVRTIHLTFRETWYGPLDGTAATVADWVEERQCGQAVEALLLAEASPLVTRGFEPFLGPMNLAI